MVYPFWGPGSRCGRGISGGGKPALLLRKAASNTRFNRTRCARRLTCTLGPCPCPCSLALTSSPALRGARVLPRAGRASSRPSISLARCAAPLSLLIRARHALLPPPKTRMSSFASRPGPTQTQPRSHRTAHSRGVPPHPPDAAAPNPASCSTLTAAPERWVPSFHRSPVAGGLLVSSPNAQA